MRNVCLLVLCFAATGCINHSIAFDEFGYLIGGEKHDAELSVIMDQAALEQEISIRSFMAGFAHKWNARPGEMVRQVSDVEFPQMFVRYQFTTSPDGIGSEGTHIDLWLSVPAYDFADHGATITMRAIAKSASGRELFDNSYTDSGITQGGKMFWGGAFAMKSAIRQSSLDALRKIFARLRADLTAAL